MIKNALRLLWSLMIKQKNKSEKLIPISKRKKVYRTSTINLSDRFLKGKITSLYNDFSTDEEIKAPLIQRFKFINEKQRTKDEDKIQQVTTPPSDPLSEFKKFRITPFYPLKNAAKVASFGSFRIYNRYGKKVSISYHKGLDLASVKRDSVKSTNAGRVVFSDFNGIYGNMVIIDHTMGFILSILSCV